ncbi:RluA family pseudouridine synthase [Henriciella barbarensis]|uniref:Pseudouridine synthase n=1 Tax=Henriciella barbarensis TaxID=86342 RepID=A0A399QZT9_9PROT|nr:RluA family pseudouridine synthase [Henriciella barbarensis]RIJ23585.1 RluA family pseudouridine synthase [Henriciella barbarensis]
MNRLTATATDTDKGTRLDRFLSEALPELSRSRAKALIKEGAVSLGGRPADDPKAGVSPGETYTLEMPDPVPATPEPEDIPLDILFEDEHLILVNKPSGMAVHPAPGSWQGTLVNALLHHCAGELSGIGGVERPGIVHRIDKGTTGVLVVAKTEPAHAGLSKLFKTHDIDRTYLAITRGAPRPLVGSVDMRIARSTSDRKKMAVIRDEESEHGRHAVTHYKAKESYGELDKGAGLPAAALIECRLETGRTHQIRVHMAHIGAPLIGDPTYGRQRGIKAYGSGEAFIDATTRARQFDRQALHAASLGFVHPVTGDEVFAEAPLPPDMDGLLSALRKI